MGERYTSSHWGTYRFNGSGIVPVDDDPDPSEAGKSWWSAMHHGTARVARPSFRKGWLDGRDRNRSGDAGFVELPWDEALDTAAAEIERVKSDHGNGAIFGGSYGWSSAGRFHHAQSQLRRFLNCIGGFVDKRNTYSHAGAEVLFPHLFGTSFHATMAAQTSWDQIADHARLVVAFGGLTPRTAQIAPGGVSRHHVAGRLNDLRSRGVRLVNVSPQASDLEGGEWLSIRPGTDRALILALSHVLFAEGLADLDFLARCTSGWEVWRERVTAYPPDWAASICDIEAEKIVALAHEMAKAPTMISCAYGFQRADRGEESLWAAINLAATLGQIGRPGTGFVFGPASMNSTSRPAPYRSWPSLPVGTNPVRDFIPVARTTEMLENPGSGYIYDGERRVYPDIRLVFWSGGNPFHHHQDLFRLERAWQKPETVIVTEHSWTATARRADIVFPATSPLEREDIMMQYRDDRIVYMSALKDRHEAARDDYEIFAGLAQRLGCEDAFTDGRSADEWLQKMWAEAMAANPELPDFKVLKGAGIIEVPQDECPQNFLSGFVSDPIASMLPTPSGKIEVASDTIADMGLPDLGRTPEWTPPREWLGATDARGLHLISPQPAFRLHAQNDVGDTSLSAKVKAREPCYLHPKTAADRGISDGDVIVLSNSRGRCLAGAILTPDIRPDCIALPTGAWMDVVVLEDGPLEIHGNPNVLTYDSGTSTLSQGNPAHTTIVRVERWTKPIPAISVFEGPEIVDLE